MIISVDVAGACVRIPRSRQFNAVSAATTAGVCERGSDINSAGGQRRQRPSPKVHIITRGRGSYFDKTAIIGVLNDDTRRHVNGRANLTQAAKQRHNDRLNELTL